MIIGLSDLQYFLKVLREAHGWDAVPARADILDAREEAIRLNDGSGSFATETAALFFAFSDVDRFGNYFRQLPLAFIFYVVEGSAFDIAEGDTEQLIELQTRIASDLASWDECRSWFERHLVKR